MSSTRSYGLRIQNDGLASGRSCSRLLLRQRCLRASFVATSSASRPPAPPGACAINANCPTATCWVNGTCGGCPDSGVPGTDSGGGADTGGSSGGGEAATRASIATGTPACRALRLVHELGSSAARPTNATPRRGSARRLLAEQASNATERWSQRQANRGFPLGGGLPTRQ